MSKKIKPTIALPRPSSLVLDPTSVSGSETVDCTVTLEYAVSYPVTVQVSTDVPADFSSLPTSVVVAANHVSKVFQAVTSENASGTPTITVSNAAGSTGAELTIQ